MNITFTNLVKHLRIPSEIALFFISEAFPYKSYSPKTLSISEYRYLLYIIAEYDYMTLVLLFEYSMTEGEIEDLQEYCYCLSEKFTGKRSDIRLIFR